MLQNTCKICNSKKINQIKLYNQEFIKCENCTIVYKAQIPENDLLNNYYKKDYKLIGDEIIETEFRRLFRATEQLELINLIHNYIQAPAKIIDIGCDNAFFLDTARRFGFEVTGIELSQRARLYAEQSGIQILQSTNETTELFDFAIMNHSLEHFTDPVTFLSELKKKLNQNAYILIRVPDFDSIYRKIFGKRWIWFQPDKHIFHFNSKSLSAALNNAGFDIISLLRHSPNNRFTKYLYYICKTFFKKYYNNKISLKKAIARHYEDLTGREILLIAKIK
ncbi:MAG: class I SAM-dependent methyltransferase [Candidatus Kapabacteria bacterium]|nr:class I SAM-dependent methyltransferase [Candidatus Kapabacteria bacterium]